MKKYFFTGIFLCLALGSFVILSYAQQADQVEVTHCSGKVEVLLEGADDYTDAEDNMVLSAGDKIKTASGASVELSFNEANTNLVRLDENTSVNVSLSGDEKLEMTEGEVFSSISELPAGSAFEIRTPTAVSGARGTDWVTKVTEEGTDVEALESVPYVRNFEAGGNLSKEITRIVPGQMTTVRKFQKPMAFRPIEGMRKQKWQQVKKEVVQRGFEAMRRRQDMPSFNRKEFIDKIKEKADFKRQDPQHMKNELRDKSEVLTGQKDKYLPGSEADGNRPANDFRERGKEFRDKQGNFLRENAEERMQRMGERKHDMEQLGQSDFRQMKNEMRDKARVLFSGERQRGEYGNRPEDNARERIQERKDKRDNFFRENIEEKNQRMENRPRNVEEKTQGAGRVGQDMGTGIKRFTADKPREARQGNAGQPQSRKPAPQRTMKPVPGRR